MKNGCHDETGMIIKPFEECEQCNDFPCIDLIHALLAIVDGDN